MAGVLLEGQDLHAWYGSSHVLQGVDLSIEAGTTLGLLGRNGMGKSTLIRTLLGHVKQRRGRIRVDGHDLSAAAPHQMARAGVAYVPEGRGVFPSLSVRENLLMAARGSGAWTLARTLQTFPRLAERVGHLGAHLSGGEQQMLAIGRALMTHPRLLILDEATEGLAPQIALQIWEVIARLRDDGIATVIVDRDHRRVAAHADRLLVLVKGRTALEGRASELAGTPPLLDLLGI
jgi:branched-chain amino acid transport system ATP-binding protein